MNEPRATHTATLLADGRVLIAGGFLEEGTREIAIASAEIYDSQTGRFTPTGDMNVPRGGHSATLLPDRKVLIAGGWGISQRIATAELYDPQTGEFSYTDSLSAPRAGMTATLLKDGRVLIAGGDSAGNTPQLTAEIFDPDTSTFTPTGSLNEGRSAHTATLLSDGRVLIAGGGLGDGEVLASAEIYDPAAGTFTKTASLNQERFKLADAVVLLNNGNVLVGGGNRQMETYDASSGEFLLNEQLDNHYYYAVLTLLKDGSVLITGGYDPNIQPTDQAWVYN